MPKVLCNLSLVCPIISKWARVKHIYICVYEEEYSTVNTIILLEGNYWLKVLVVPYVMVVC